MLPLTGARRFVSNLGTVPTGGSTVCFSPECSAWFVTETVLFCHPAYCLRDKSFLSDRFVNISGQWSLCHTGYVELFISLFHDKA